MYVRNEHGIPCAIKGFVLTLFRDWHEPHQACVTCERVKYFTKTIGCFAVFVCAHFNKALRPKIPRNIAQLYALVGVELPQLIYCRKLIAFDELYWILVHALVGEHEALVSGGKPTDLADSTDPRR